MSQTIEIARSAKDQRAAVLETTMAAYREYADKSDKAFWIQYERSIERTILTDDSITQIVAKSAEKIMGSVLYCPPYERRMGVAIVKNPFPEMRLLAVPPEFRNHGIAGRLIEFCEELAISSNSPTITLHTTVLMQTAKQMYEKRGYVRYPDIDFEPVPLFIVWGYRKDF